MTERTLREKIETLEIWQGDDGRTSLVSLASVLALIDAHTAEPAPELCDVCGGHGMAGHPDSGAVCYRCNGTGAAQPAPDAVAEALQVADDFLGKCASHPGRDFAGIMVKRGIAALAKGNRP